MIHKRILFVEFLKITAANHLIMIIKGLLKQQDCSVVLLCQRSSFLAKSLKDLPVTVYEIEYKEFQIKDPRTYAAFVRETALIVYIIVKHGITAFHCHRLNWAYLCVLPSLFFRIPLYVHIVIIEKLTSKFQNCLLHIHKHIWYIAVSKHALVEFKKLYTHDVRHITYHYGGLYFPDMEAARHKKFKTFERKHKSGKKIIAMVSRMDPMKGVDVFIDAAALLSKKYPTLRFVHIGNHPDYVFQDQYYEDCKKRVRSLHLSSVFRFIDYTDDVLAAYKYFYLCVLPTYKDTLSYVNLEANYYGIPVLYTDVGGLRETASKRFECSIPFPPSPVVLSERIEQYLRDANAYAKLQKEVSSFVRKRFNAQKNSGQLADMYKRKITG